jgi:hypothetical protein
VAASILLGVFAVVKLPREEEFQIVVLMIDVFVEMPGASARSRGARHQAHGEAAVEIPGVEYIYSTSSPGVSMAVVRFFVGEDEEKAIVRLNQKLSANLDLIPPGASLPLIKPRSIDDVPILALTLWSKRYGDYELRRLAAQLHDSVKQVDQVSAVAIIGGQCHGMCRGRRHRGASAAEFSGRLACAFRCHAGNRRTDSGTPDVGRLRRSRRLTGCANASCGALLCGNRASSAACRLHVKIDRDAGR